MLLIELFRGEKEVCVMIYMVVSGDETDGVCLQLLLPPQDTAFLLPAVDTAV